MVSFYIRSALPRAFDDTLPNMADSADDVECCEEARRELEGYLNKRMRIRISDGRVIDGMLVCTDRDCNIVLANCEEFFSQEELGMYTLVRNEVLISVN